MRGVKIRQLFLSRSLAGYENARMSEDRLKAGLQLQLGPNGTVLCSPSQATNEESVRIGGRSQARLILCGDGPNSRGEDNGPWQKSFAAAKMGFSPSAASARAYGLSGDVSHKVGTMAERKKQFTRTEKRAEAKKKVARNVRPWPMSLELNVAKIRRLADDEWNFEKLFDQVRKFAGGSVTREVLQEYMKAKQITIKSRPKASAKPM